MESVDNSNNNNNSNSNNNSNNNKEKSEKTKRSFNPFRRDNSKSVSFSPLKQQEAVVIENNNNNISNSNNNNIEINNNSFNNNSNSDNNIISNNNSSNNSNNNNLERPSLNRQDSNSSISSTYSTSSCASTIGLNNNSNSSNTMNRPRSKSEKKDKLSFGTLVSKASRKSMRIVIGNNSNNGEMIQDLTTQQSSNSTTTNLNSSTNSLSSNISTNEEYFRNLNIASGSGTLSAQDKKKNRGSIFVRLLSRKNKDDPITEEDFKIESQPNGGSLPPIGQSTHQTQPQQQFSSTPNLLAQSYSFNGHQNHPSSSSAINLLNHNNQPSSSPQLQQQQDNNYLTSSMISPIKSNESSCKKETLESREETIKKIQMMANQLNETVKIPSSQRNHQHSALNGNITPPRALDRQSSEQSFLSSYHTTPISTTPLSNQTKSNPFDKDQQHNNSNEEGENEYSIDSGVNIETSSTNSSHHNQVLVPSASSTSLSISSSSAFSPPSPIVQSQQQQQTSSFSANKHKRYTVAIPKWDVSMNFNGNPFERLVQVLRNSTDVNVVNNDYEEQLIQQQLNQLLIEEQQQQQQNGISNRHSIQLESPRLKSLPQSVIDGIEEEKQKRSILMLCLSKLLKKLISEPNDESILFKSFFTTYDCLYDSKDILNELSNLFKTESPQIQLRICIIIKFWLKDYYISQLCDFSFASEFKDFIVDIKDIQDSYLYSKILDLRNQLIYLLETKITERCLDVNSSSNGVNNSSDSIDNSPESIEKRYLSKKSTLKIKTFLSTSLKSYGFDIDFQQQPPSPPSSPTHSRRFSPQTTHGYMDGGVLSYSSLEQNNENEYDNHHHHHHHHRQNSISISTSTSFSLSSSTSSSNLHRKHNRSISSNSDRSNINNNNNNGNNNNNLVFTTAPISSSNSLSFNQSTSSTASNTFWVQTRPRSSTWSSSDIFLSIMDAPAKEIAKSLTAIDFSIFLCIETQELMNGAWGKPHLKDKAPNIIKLISRFNEISMNVIQTILNEEKLKDRCKVMARFIKIAKNLHELRNYNSLMAIYAGISHSSITRLKWTKKILPKTHQKTLQDLEKLMESDENFKNYRTELKTITSPCIPFLGLILSDMTFIQEGNPDYIGTNEDSWQLNINKLKLMYNCIKQIQNFQKTAYLLNADPRLTLILTPNSNIFGEPQINYYQQSSQQSQQQSQQLPLQQQSPQLQDQDQEKEKQINNNSTDELLLPRSQIESIVSTTTTGSTTTTAAETTLIKEDNESNKDLTKMFTIPPLKTTNTMLEKKNSNHDLLFRSFTLEDSIAPVRKYSFNTWSSPKKVNFDIFNSNLSNSSSNSSSNNPIKMERSQSEKYLPLNKVIPFNISSNNNSSSSPREIESEVVKLTKSLLENNSSSNELNCNSNNKNQNNENNNNENNATYSNSSASPSLSRPNQNNNGNGSPTNSPTVSPQISIITPPEDLSDSNNKYKLNKSCDNNIDNDAFNLLDDGSCQIAEELVFSIKGQNFTKNRRKSVSTSNIHSINPLSSTNNTLLKPGLVSPRSANNSPQTNSGNVSPNSSNISTVGSQSLFKRKSFDQHFIPRPAHSFVPMTDESLFSLSLKLEPRGVKLSDLA